MLSAWKMDCISVIVKFISLSDTLLSFYSFYYRPLSTCIAHELGRMY